MLHNEEKQDSRKIKKEKKKFPSDFSNDPTFNKRADESKAFLDRVGFPKELIPKK